VTQTLANMDALERMFELAADIERDRLAAASSSKQ
jgi:hypothetical protein